MSKLIVDNVYLEYLQNTSGVDILTLTNDDKIQFSDAVALPTSELPVWTSATRPSTGTLDYKIGYNTDRGLVEVYDPNYGWWSYSEKANGLVQAGLTLHYDFADPDCYPGYGTSVYDLTTNVNNGRMVGGVQYVTTGEKYMQFNGSQYIDIANVAGSRTFAPGGSQGGGWTVEHWAYFDEVVNSSLYNFIGASAITENSWYWTVYQSKLALWNIDPGAWYYGDTTLTAGNWYHCVLSMNNAGNTTKMYINGVAEGGTQATYSWNSADSGLVVDYIGRGDASNGRYHKGRYAEVRFYRRTLSDNEVLQNYNATKSRYGL